IPKLWPVHGMEPTCVLRARLRVGRVVVDAAARESKKIERRALKRTRVSRNAKIIVPRRSPVIFCTVENITGGGACLKLASTFGVPETFDLTFEHGRTRRLCRVVWRTNNKLGVAFGSAA
ncbi:MAG TPA: PilZ domain-containing protein, partial [Xanthobacteraceae bacterium]|nr:PilZ domain-containing protein [Xanthobacteraceae bacterium]